MTDFKTKRFRDRAAKDAQPPTDTPAPPESAPPTDNAGPDVEPTDTKEPTT